MIAAPLFAQPADIDDEASLLIVADMGSQDTPGTPAATHGQAQQPGPAGMREHHGWGGPMRTREGGMAAFLNLTPDQLAKMGDLHNRYYMQTRDLRYDLMVGRLESIRLFLDPKADSAAILAKQGQVSALRQRLADTMARMMVDARAILTPEQIQKLDMAFLAHGMGMARHPMGPGMHEGMEGHSMMGQGMMSQGK